MLTGMLEETTMVVRSNNATSSCRGFTFKSNNTLHNDGTKRNGYEYGMVPIGTYTFVKVNFVLVYLNL